MNLRKCLDAALSEGCFLFMARALRVEYPKANYHVMCRGNQSRDIFEVQEGAALFVRCVGELCTPNQVDVHAWCLMSNHHRVLLETPQGNEIL